MPGGTNENGPSLTYLVIPDLFVLDLDLAIVGYQVLLGRDVLPGAGCFTMRRQTIQHDPDSLFISGHRGIIVRERACLVPRFYCRLWTP
jgi:hypothetical protein